MVVGLDSQSVLPSGVIQTPWMHEELVCLAANENARVEEALDMMQFACLTHVELTDISGLLPSRIESCLAQHGLTRRVISKNLNYIAAARVVALTDAIMTLPRQMAERFVTMLPVRLVAPPEQLPALNMTLIQHGLYANDPAIVWLYKQLMAFAKAFSRPSIEEKSTCLIGKESDK
jgi:DNA-binding transcriptional LysR family regulator